MTLETKYPKALATLGLKSLITKHEVTKFNLEIDQVSKQAK